MMIGLRCNIKITISLSARFELNSFHPLRITRHALNLHEWQLVEIGTYLILDTVSCGEK